MDYLKTQAPFWKKETDAGGRALGRRAGGRRRGARALGHRRRQRRSARPRGGRPDADALAAACRGPAGGVVGCLLRWLAGVWLNARWSGFPLGTLFVNCVGGLLIGMALFWFERTPNELLRLLVVTGMLGGFTTFSSFSGESLSLLQRGDLRPGLGHTPAHVLGALACAAIGFRTAPAFALAR